MKAKRLPSGRYRTQLFIGYDENGKRIVKSFTADTEFESLRMAKEFLADRNENMNNNFTLSDAMGIYIASRNNVIEKTTIRTYKQIHRCVFQSIMHIRIKELQPIDIQKAINIESERLSPKYIRNSYGLLKAVLKMFEININLNNIILPRQRKNDKELPDFKTIFSIFHGTNSELPVLLSSWLSLRIGEILGLQFRDVDTVYHTIKIRRTVIRTENGFELRDGCKTEKSTRELALPDYLYDMIIAIPHNSDEDAIIPVSRKTLYTRFKKLTRSAGIEMSFHDLRHLNASIMLMLGIPDKYAMERGGWSTDNILKSVYQQTFSSERKRVDSVIDDYFNSIINDI